MTVVLGAGRGNRGLVRLVVLQVLVCALFVTLFARLWYLQVVAGDTYRAQAAEQSVREIVQQPARGLIVDDMGRPLVANRTSWVVTVDRTMLHKMSGSDEERLLRRLARTVRATYRTILARTTLCGEPRSVHGVCWNGSPFQPVPVAEDVAQRSALSLMERSEDYPSVLVQAESVRAYPAPFGINAAHVLGYLSPITAEEMDQAESDHDTTVHGASLVGRAGLEKQYDEYLRGSPGYRRVAVDSMGRVLGDSGVVPGREGDTLVTTLDARVQSVVEQQLRQTIRTARATYDPVSHRKYVADQGAVVVLDKQGDVVAMASYPTYDPKVWVGGITARQLKDLYSARSGTPLLSRATQGQFAPGSTWKPIMTTGAFGDGFGPQTRLNCSSGVQVGNRLFQNYESASYGMIDFAKALQISCDTFFYRVGLALWERYGSEPANVDARDPLVEMAQRFGFGSETGIDLPGEAGGRIADRRWKLAYYRANRDYYCRMVRQPSADSSPYLRLFAHEFCLEGYLYRAGDAVNFSIGQGDTVVTPLQLARAYTALHNGGRLYRPRIAKAIVDPEGHVVRRFPPRVTARVPASRRTLRYVDTALAGTPKVGTLARPFVDFPLDKVHVHGKTGSAEVHGKQSTSWVASYTEDYTVVMMVSQAGTGSGTAGPAVRKIYEALYGVRGMRVNPSRAALPGTTPPRSLPVFAENGEILPPRALPATS